VKIDKQPNTIHPSILSMSITPGIMNVAEGMELQWCAYCEECGGKCDGCHSLARLFGQDEEAAKIVAVIKTRPIHVVKAIINLLNDYVQLEESL